LDSFPAAALRTCAGSAGADDAAVVFVLAGSAEPHAAVAKAIGATTARPIVAQEPG